VGTKVLTPVQNGQGARKGAQELVGIRLLRICRKGVPEVTGPKKKRGLEYWEKKLYSVPENSERWFRAT